MRYIVKRRPVNRPAVTSNTRRVPPANIAALLSPAKPWLKLKLACDLVLESKDLKVPFELTNIPMQD